MPRPNKQREGSVDDNSTSPNKIPASSLNEKDDDNISMLSDIDYQDNMSVESKRRSSSNASNLSRRGQVNRARGAAIKQEQQGPGWWGRTVQAFRNRGQNDDDSSVTSKTSQQQPQRRVSRSGSSVGAGSMVPPVEPETIKETRLQEAERHAFSRWMKSIFEREGLKRKKELATLARVEGPVFW
jgi:hypothetical protein